ncbi:hypothetical protein E2C01_010909 [Portunus trituberculatus]|uniref:Uncharacterized protein n=1 Tax=Portunus trituberculatus TaxID=210409 RepID=A0A5B7D9W2_PORTR|nr:hypothetical protein [Portunus trituberculatus]
MFKGPAVSSCTASSRCQLTSFRTFRLIKGGRNRLGQDGGWSPLQPKQFSSARWQNRHRQPRQQATPHFHYTYLAMFLSTPLRLAFHRRSHSVSPGCSLYWSLLHSPSLCHENLT